MPLIKIFIILIAGAVSHAAETINHINLGHEYQLQAGSSTQCPPVTKPHVEVDGGQKTILVLNAKLGFEWEVVSFEKNVVADCAVSSTQTIEEAADRTIFVLQIAADCKHAPSDSLRDTLILQDQEISFVSSPIVRERDGKTWVVDKSKPTLKCLWKER